MKRTFLPNISRCAALALALPLTAQAATVTIENLNIRSGGSFNPDASGETINGAAPGGNVVADPINFSLTLNNLDLDGDATANDSVTFTIVATGGGATQRIFGQGIDTGFGALNDVTLSVTGVSGTATDSGDLIVFDGFTGAQLGAGAGGGMATSNLIDATVDINGASAAIAAADTGAGFQFVTSNTDFAGPESTVLFENSVNNAASSIVIRAVDLQFSTVPEPSSALLLGLAGLGLLRRRR